MQPSVAVDLLVPAMTPKGSAPCAAVAHVVPDPVLDTVVHTNTRSADFVERLR